jgi:AcrR family transcriptional regulator
MTPRSYDMTKRARAREETRKRIVEATARLHAEHGVLGTSWKQIAEEADVSVATVYAHFPSLDELLPACGLLVMERVQPPSLEAAAELVGATGDLEERLGRAARELFAFYERGGPYIEVDVRERQLPEMQEWEQYMLSLVAAFVREALAQTDVPESTFSSVCALLDLPTFKAFSARGVAPEEAAGIAAQLAAVLVERTQAVAVQDKKRRRKR